ncbi:fibroblast growth factor receptor 2-like [Ptychodera flava]|uniref:fibroblast growth factor receptor 2-like n=1 Tax=Ptychodera flava TaxID=63121 RepID=UPI003969F21D
MAKEIFVALLALSIGLPTESEWTRYFNIDNADDEGDKELVTEVRQIFPRFMCSNPTRIEVLTEGGIAAKETGEVFSVYDVSRGFYCRNEDQSDGVCENYKVRFCCPGGQGAEWCLTNEELKQNSVKANFSVNIAENVKLGSDIWKLPFHDIATTSAEFNESNVISVEIVDGNKVNRFSISKNNSSVILYGFLDVTISSYYGLLIYLTSEKGTVLAVRININVIDDPDWPPVYNTTCETITTTNNIGKLHNSPIDITYRGRSVLNDIPLFGVPPYFVFNNSKCDLQYYISIPRQYLGIDSQQMLLNVFFEVNNTKFVTYEVLQKEDDDYAGIDFDDSLFYRARLSFSGFDSHFTTRSYLEASLDGKGIFAKFDDPFEANFVGCPRGKYGGRCQFDCICKIGATCHAWNGACKCPVGWIGPACDIPIRGQITLESSTSNTSAVVMYSSVDLSCSINIEYDSVAWTKDGIEVQKHSLRILASLLTKSLHVLLMENVTKEDSGVYRCIAYRQGDVSVSNQIVVNVAGCKPNVWGEKCDRVCNCVHAATCRRESGCVCENGWDGHYCQLDVQSPEIHNCPDNITMPSARKSSVVVDWKALNVTDNAGPPTVTSNYMAGSEFNIGITTVMINVSDGVNNAFCSFTVNVEDTEAPEISCPPDMKFYVEENSDVTVVNWTTPKVNDNSDNISVSSTFSPGDSVSIGEYFVIYIASDPSGNTASCSFSMSVVEAPSAKNRLITLLSVTAVFISLIAASVFVVFFRKKPKTRVYMPLDDMLSIPNDIRKINMNDLTVLRLIGQGEFSVVKSGKLNDERGNVTDVAIKILVGNYNESTHTFVEECERLNDLKNHENIVQLVGVVFAESRKYIVTELMECDLRTLLTDVNVFGRKDLDTDRRLVKFALHTSRAMQYMELMKIVHRDIAARNVLISHDDVAKIGDFGFARDVYQTGEYHCHHGRQGRFPTRWMAPESLRDDIYSFKSDIWSFGVLLWEIATLGTSPKYHGIDDCHVKALCEYLLQGGRLPKPKDCANEIFRMMSRCWASNPADRCSANDMVHELSRLIELNGGSFFKFCKDLVQDDLNVSEYG